MTSENALILREDILRSFPRTSPPKYGEITVETTLDGKMISEAFEGENWWEISTEVLEDNYNALPLLTSSAYYYYLPAYLMSALKNLEPHNQLLEFTVYSLCPTKTAPDDHYYSQRIRRFTASEKGLIQRFLMLIIEDERLYTLYNDAQRGLRKFWSGNAISE